VLVVDKDVNIVKGMPAALGSLGVVVTAISDDVRARDLFVHKFFTAALIDVDTPNPGAGLQLLRFIHEKSPLTSVILLTARKSFDVAVAGFREHAADVVLKEPDSIPYLKKRVAEIAHELQSVSERTTLLEDVAEIHEEFLRQMRDLSRQRLNLEDRLLGRDTGDAASPDETCSVLLVDDDPEATVRFAKALPQSRGWRITQAYSGGEALDMAAQVRPQVALIKESLPDLPGRIVVSSVKTGAPDLVTLLYDPPVRGGTAGFLRMMEGTRVMDLSSDFKSPGQLVGPMAEVREGLRQKLKERRYLQSFRQSHLDFLQRYNQLRLRIERALNRGKRQP
jgi:DNA-binding response OmpR family regulator